MAVKPARIGPAERLQVTLLFSLILHAVVVLGITFQYEDPAAQLPSLDVILVQSASTKAPDKADFLANAAQQGGGESKRSKRPRDLVSGPIPKATDGLAPQTERAGSPRPTEATPRSVLSGADTTVSVQKIEDSHPEIPELTRLTAQELIERDMEMARLTAEVDRQREQYAKRPRRKFVSASTREYAFAAYMRAWVAKVERIGNVNYPEEARRRELYGQLVITVAVRRDGSLESIETIQGSGQDFLDLAARRIVELSAPFPPLPKTAENIDVLHITRTWQFLPGDVLRGE
ncbi:MAG: energy transducer TonB [Lysobacterales bacterium CG02_land_8_20_14_3_00_62_12]|nr:MAG: energy transducer TonB [Xanthomonadales bacterium CG02_land_8_20_14_3_00_62_12]